MNEVLLRLPFSGKTPMEKKRPYYDFVNGVAHRIEEAIRSLDPLRPTMIPCNSSVNVYKESGLGEIPDILGWNLYKGWYGGQLSDFGPAMDEIHAKFPDKGIIVSEYGADNDARCHSFHGERFDFTEEYGVTFHKEYMKVIMDRDYIAGSNVWNINDFYSEGRGDAIPHVNCKGLTTRNRTPKDSYWLYKAVLGKEPFIMIAGHDWLIRGGDEGERQPSEVYTNASSVRLVLNGKPLGTFPAKDGYAPFEVTWAPGHNVLEAVAEKDGKTVRDVLRVDYRAVPADMSKFVDMSVSLGGTRFFEDKDGSLIWIPEKEYTPGRWGYIGGETGRVKTNRGSQPCTNADILGTSEDPLWQMQRKGLEAFKADVPDGKYYVYLYFCELNIGKDKVIRLAYSLGNDVVGEDVSERVFDVDINGQNVLKDYNIRREDGELHPVIKKFTVEVEGGEGLTVGFTPVKGQPVLNAIRIYRCN
jgi:beta-galactosidase